jgi:hypothetical protein
MPTENIQNETIEVVSLDNKVKGLTGYVIKIKLAKDKHTAERRMLMTSFVFFAISIYFFAKAGNLI